MIVATDTVGPPLDYGDKYITQKTLEWAPEKEATLLGPYDYLCQQRGKNIRGQMMDAFNQWLRVPEADLDVIKKAIGMLHTASLLMDDVQDASLLRRGLPVANLVFGTAQTLNSANYVYFLALQELATLNNPELNTIYIQELVNLHRGQGMELFWRDTLKCPSEEDYLEMASNKTAALFRLAIRLMQAQSPASDKVDCVPLVSTIGLLYQIMDDYLNLQSVKYSKTKGFCEDLSEGKFSFPVIHAIHADPHNSTLVNILRQKSCDEDVKRVAVAYIEKMGSFEYTRKAMEVLELRALALVAELEIVSANEGGKTGGEAIRKIINIFKTL